MVLVCFVHELFLTAIGAIPHDALAGFTVLGELGLDGSLTPVAVVARRDRGERARRGFDLPARGPEAVGEP